MLALVLSCLVVAAPADFTSFHVIGDVATRGRHPAHTDSVEAAVIDGSFAVGEKWEVVEPNAQGVLEHDWLRGGYAFATISREDAGPAVLSARGSSMVYVNGVPRMGDPYSSGLLRLPVMLQKGENEFLFRVGRGRLTASLHEAQPRLAFMGDDDTTPDLIVGAPVDALVGVQIGNFTTEWLNNATILATGPGGEEQPSFLGAIPPMSVRKIPVRLSALSPEASGEMTFTLAIIDPGVEAPIDERTMTLAIVEPEATRRVTFQSDIDGSVQFYGLTPAVVDPQARMWPGIILTLHGAGVDAKRQAACYQPKDFAHVVAPTNRRPFGFDWEDWGRLDALEALEHAQRTLSSDPRKQWLTGHSMGGHGVWQVAVQRPHFFAAIGPSAGWRSFFSYGTDRPEVHDEIDEVLARAFSPSDTLLLKQNLMRPAVFILHGEEDDNVPVAEARAMREHLQDHPDLEYHEQEGAGHWWGNECVDWPPMIEFFKGRTRAAGGHDEIDFTTVDPGISSRNDWVEINAQIVHRAPSRIEATRDPDSGRVEITTDNVERLRLHLPADIEWSFVIDGQPIRIGARQVLLARGAPATFVKMKGTWKNVLAISLYQKNPRRAGAFKDAFRNGMVFVVGTVGTPEETAANTQKAIYDAEQFLYRGNGSPEVVRDQDFDLDRYTGRNIILYGNQDTNGAWETMLPDSPVTIDRTGILIGDKRIEGDDLALLMIRPQQSHRWSSVGVVAGTGPKGMRLTEQLPYFVAGVHYPDLTVFGPEMLEEGVQGIRAAGFFGNDWSIEEGDIVVRGLDE
jgi:hypothetical protein